MILSRFLETSTTKNGNGDYSSSEESFFIKPTGRRVFLIRKLIVTIENAFLSLSGYGSDVSTLTENELTNGISIQASDDTTTNLDLLDGLKIMSTADYLRHNFKLISDGANFGGGVPYLNFEYTFDEPIRLDAKESEKFEIILNDDFSDLDYHYFLVRGLDVEEGSRVDVENR